MQAWDIRIVEDQCSEIDGGERYKVVVEGSSKAAVESHAARQAVAAYCKSQRFWPARLSPIVDGLTRVPSETAGEDPRWRLVYRMIQAMP